MKLKSFVVGVAGAALLVAIIVTWFGLLSPAPKPKELSFEQAIARIRNQEASEVLIRQDSLEITDKNGAEFFTRIDGQKETLGIIHEAANGTGTKVNVELPSGGISFVFLLYSMRFYIMWGVTLAIIVYAVTVLSRNKG
jgi:hypothetical protein